MKETNDRSKKLKTPKPSLHVKGRAYAGKATIHKRRRQGVCIDTKKGMTLMATSLPLHF